MVTRGESEEGGDFFLRIFMELYEIVCQTLENCKVLQNSKNFHSIKKNAQSPVSEKTMSLQKRSVALRTSPRVFSGEHERGCSGRVEGRTPCWGRAKKVL